MLASIPNVQTTDRNQNQAFSYALSQLRNLTNNPLLNGNILRDGIVLQGATAHSVGIPLLASASPNIVLHGLGRVLLGWFLVRKNANAEIWDSQLLNTSKASTELWLNCSADVTVDLYVF